MTKSRPSIFFEGENGVVHVYMQEPYCQGDTFNFAEKK